MRIRKVKAKSEPEPKKFVYAEYPEEIEKLKNIFMASKQLNTFIVAEIKANGRPRHEQVNISHLINKSQYLQQFLMDIKKIGELEKRIEKLEKRKK